MRSITIDLPDQKVLTTDGLVYDVSVNLVYRVEDPIKALTLVDHIVSGRVPVAAAPATGGVALVDRQGRVLAVTAAPPPDRPVLTGLPAAGAPGSMLAGRVAELLAVAQALPRYGRRIGVVPAGEHWADGSLRPAVEDLLGAGAIIQHLPGTRSPEAAVAETTFLHLQTEVTACLQQCTSGKELIGRGFAQDVAVAAAVDQSACVPILSGGAYVRSAHD